MGLVEKIDRETSGETHATSSDELVTGSADEPIGSASEPMAKVRPEEAAGALLARARVFGALFGDQSAVGKFGRFSVVNHLGSGGMGVVYEAYDPDLARGVALKLVNVASKDREAALAEAQALARLSHPNVVPIFDVGLDGELVYLVMELVRGKTLRDWPEGRGLREILAVYNQAGLALAAAHDARLVHRDFKPDNAIVGGDGRVRVVDFGLACEADDPSRAASEPRRAAGTPRFMAPEIKAGAAITPAADQYSFCVALAESLQLARESTPRWVAAVIERGRAANAAERFGSMSELLRALARDPARTRRRITLVGGFAATVSALAFFVGRHTPGEAPDLCNDGAAQLEAVWSPAERSAALDRVATLGAYGRSLRPLLERRLEAHAGRWTRENRAACVDLHRRSETDTMSDRRRTCLDRGRDALAAVGKLIGEARPDTLAALPLAVQSMPDPADCSDRNALSSDIAPPSPALREPVAQLRRQITQADILVGTGRYEQALAETRAAVDQARTLGYSPALAEALLVQGHAQMLTDLAAAVPILAEATQVAMAARADALAVEAWARRAYALGTTTDPDGALGGLEVIEPLAQRTPAATFARALLHNNLGSVALARSREDDARRYFEIALKEAQLASGGGALELSGIRKNLALVTPDRLAADKLLSDVVVELTGRLGPEHPYVLEAQWMRVAVVTEDLRRADESLAPLCRVYERYPTLTTEIALCWAELGFVRWDLGRRDGALDAMARAVNAPDDVPEAAPYLSLLRGDARAAVRQFTQAIEKVALQPREPWWVQRSRALLMLGLGRALREMGDLRGARQALERSIADYDAVVRQHPATSYERRLGRARVELAFTLAQMNVRSAGRTEAVVAGLAWLLRVHGTWTEILKLLRVA